MSKLMTSAISPEKEALVAFNVPNIPDELIEYLEQIFPNKLPDEPEMHTMTINKSIGEQGVIRHLKSINLRQNK